MRTWKEYYINTSLPRFVSPRRLTEYPEYLSEKQPRFSRWLRNSSRDPQLRKTRQTMLKKGLWSDRTETNLSVLHVRLCVWEQCSTAHHPAHIIPTLKNAMFFLSRDREDGQRLNCYWVQKTWHSDWMFILQQKNNPRFTSRATMK